MMMTLVLRSIKTMLVRMTEMITTPSMATGVIENNKDNAGNCGDNEDCDGDDNDGDDDND
jgi:hypothetical protein